MGRLKKLLTLVLSVALLLTINVSVFGAELNANEKKILAQFNEEPFSSNLDKKYINQFENYFSQDNVTIEKSQADSFIEYSISCFAVYSVPYGLLATVEPSPSHE